MTSELYYNKTVTKKKKKKNKVLLFPWRKQFNVISQPWSTWWILLRNEWYRSRDSVLVSAAGRWGTYQWQEPGQPWRAEVLVAEPVYNLHHCHLGHTVYELIGQIQGSLEKVADWCPQSGLPYSNPQCGLFLTFYFLRSLFVEHSHETQISSHSVEIYPHTSSPDSVAVSDHLAENH